MRDWYPWYPEVYDGDTIHLTLTQDAIYRRLIDWYMRARQPIHDNDQALANAARVSLEVFAPNASVIRAFFKVKGGFLHLKKCDVNLDRQDNLSRKRSVAAAKGAEKRHKKTPNDSNGSQASARQNSARGRETQTETVKDSESDTSSESLFAPSEIDRTVSRITRVKKTDFERFWKAYPKPRNGGKDPAWKQFAKVAKTVDPEFLIEKATQYANSAKVAEGFVVHVFRWLRDGRYNDEGDHPNEQHRHVNGAGPATGAVAGAILAEQHFMAKYGDDAAPDHGGVDGGPIIDATPGRDSGGT